MRIRPRAARCTVVAAATVGVWTVLIGGPARRAIAADMAAEFVDERRCAECHAAEQTAWRGSHHDLAMQAATEATVLGDFADATFTYNGTTTRFFRRGAGYFVSTDGPGGEPTEYQVEHVFGVAPLQQVLLALPGGRLQAFSIAWDTEQRHWFHLYPGERIDHRDELHWTKPSQNWNFMCAECHTTGFEKNYDAASDRYASRWFRDDVGCQACHGPGAQHVAWADAAAKGGASAPAVSAPGLVLTAAATANVEIEACARCHSRRSVIAPRYDYGKSLLDAYLPATLDEPLYTADGQIHDEVYEYGSFLQSKMAKKGLRCSDCHDPHSLRLRADGNALCATCHNSTGSAARAGIDTSGLRKKTYDDPEHHFHQPGTPGSRCVDCHAPKKHYMVVDPRADHSFRIPRPDLTTALGVPNACNGCHTDKSPAWAEEAIRSHAPGYVPAPHYAAAIAAGRDGKSGAVRLMAAAAADSERAPIVRATLLELLARYPGAIAGQLFANGLRDPDALVRRAAAGGFELLPPPARVRPLAPLLRDPVRAVRIEAARLLTPVDAATLEASDRDARLAALRELEASYGANADREEGRLGLANLYAELGRSAEAEGAYRSALKLYPFSVPAAVNLADFYRARGNDHGAESVLREALSTHPGDPALDYSLALCLVRQGQKTQALELLASAVRAAPDRPNIAYAYAAALADAGRRDDAIGVLERALGRSRGDRDILLALVSFLREAGDTTAADAYLEELAAINPADPALAASGPR